MSNYNSYWDNAFISYKSKGRTITKSTTHKDLWVITCSDGVGWFSISTTEEQMRTLNPPDPEPIRRPLINRY